MFFCGSDNVFSVAYQRLENPVMANYYKHAHDTYEFLLFISGDATYNIEGVVYELSPFDLIIIPPTHYHYLELKGNMIYERFLINFRSSDLDVELEKMLCPACVVNISEETELKKVFLRLISYFKRFSREDFMIVAKNCLNEIILLINYIDTSNRNIPSANRTLNQILEYISENLDKPIEIDDIANALYLSSSHIQNLFSQHMKIGIRSYINQKKILTAQALIRSGKKPVVVAQSIGFSNYATFFRAYKKFTSTVPSTAMIKKN